MKDEVLDYLQTVPGSDWSTEEKKVKLYELVKECASIFPGTKTLSVELGVFAGASLFCLAEGHKAIGNGFAVGIDTWDNIAPLEGSNSDANNEWWAKVDMRLVFNSFRKSIEHLQLKDYCKYLKGRTDRFAADFNDGTITLLHQDGNHNEELITRELELWSPKVKLGGLWVADDTNWVEAKAGYAKLPQFGFELIADFETWQIWRKTKEVKDMPVFDEIEHSDSDGCNEIAKGKRDDCLQISNYNIKPIAIHLPDTTEWVERGLRAKKHFEESGVTGIHWMAGIHAKKFQIKGTGIYLLDDRPEEKFYVGDANVGNFLTQYCAYCVMEGMDYSHFMYLEDDCQFLDGWKDQLTLALQDIPEDFDMLYVGSCCCMGKQPELVSARSGLYRFPSREGEKAWQYNPLCTHCYIVAKKAIPYIISTQRDTSNPTDVSLARFSLPSLKVYAMLPRLAKQFNTDLHE